MKRIPVLVAAVVLMAASTLHARVFIGDSFVLTPDERLREELLLVAENSRIAGAIDSEVIGVAWNSLISGSVRGDIISGALNQEFRGFAANDAYLLGESLTLGGRIRGSLTALGREVNGRDCVVNGNLRMGAHTVIFSGDIGGKTTIWGTNVSLSGTYHDLIVYGRDIRLDDRMVIAGDFTYHSARPIKIPAGIRISGKVSWKQPVSRQVERTFLARKFKPLMAFFSLLVPFLLMAAFSPNLLAQTVSLVGREPVRVFLLGLLFILTASLFSLIILATLVAAPFAIIMLSILISLLYIARPFPCIWFTRILLSRMPKQKFLPLLSTILGIVLFVLLTSLPKIGIIINLLSVPFGFGALVDGRLRMVKKLRQEGFL